MMSSGSLTLLRRAGQPIGCWSRSSPHKARALGRRWMSVDSPRELSEYEQLRRVLAPYSVPSQTAEVHLSGFCRIDGERYPAVGFGTYPLTGEKCAAALDKAAEAGYRIIDTGTFYNNFKPIGEVLKKRGREQFYVVSKVWPDKQTSAGLQEDIRSTLEQLQTHYLDAYLLHWPNSKTPIEETLQTMEQLRNRRQLRHIGLSNVTEHHVKRALEVGVPITWVQVEMHPLFYDDKLLKVCRERGIAVQAWAPLGRGRVSRDTALEQIGKKYGKTASQVALKWIVQHGCLPLPGSSSEKHIQQNRDILNFTLSEPDVQAINERAMSGKRERVTEAMGLGFADEFDYTAQQCWPKL